MPFHSSRTLLAGIISHTGRVEPCIDGALRVVLHLILDCGLKTVTLNTQLFYELIKFTQH